MKISNVLRAAVRPVAAALKPGMGATTAHAGETVPCHIENGHPVQCSDPQKAVA